MNELEKFAQLVREMRDLQRSYFKGDKAKLRYAIEVESEVDSEVRRILDREKDHEGV